MTTKRKVIYGATGAIVILGGFLLTRAPERMPLKYRPQLIERPDESFQFLDSKVTRQSEVSFVCRGNLCCRIKLYTDRVLGALRLRKPLYRVGGTSDFLSITYRSEELSETSCAQPFFKDEQDKTVFPNTFYSTYDAKTGTGTLTVAIPKSVTNRWKLHLNIPPDGKGFFGGKYAVFKF